MKYKKIVNIEQYDEYCELHEQMGLEDSEKHRDELELLEILIDEFDRRTAAFSKKMNPVELLTSILDEEDISKAELARKLGTSRQLISDILRYRRNISKGMVAKLSEHFKMRPEAFSRPYQLIQQSKSRKKQTA